MFIRHLQPFITYLYLPIETYSNRLITRYWTVLRHCKYPNILQIFVLHLCMLLQTITLLNKVGIENGLKVWPTFQVRLSSSTLFVCWALNNVEQWKMNRIGISKILVLLVLGKVMCCPYLLAFTHHKQFSQKITFQIQRFVVLREILKILCYYGSIHLIHTHRWKKRWSKQICMLTIQICMFLFQMLYIGWVGLMFWW